MTTDLFASVNPCEGQIISTAGANFQLPGNKDNLAPKFGFVDKLPNL